MIDVNYTVPVCTMRDREAVFVITDKAVTGWTVRNNKENQVCEKISYKLPNLKVIVKSNAMHTIYYAWLRISVSHCLSLQFQVQCIPLKFREKPPQRVHFWSHNTIACKHFK